MVKARRPITRPAIRNNPTPLNRVTRIPVQPTQRLRSGGSKIQHSQQSNGMHTRESQKDKMVNVGCSREEMEVEQPHASL